MKRNHWFRFAAAAILMLMLGISLITGCASASQKKAETGTTSAAGEPAVLEEETYSEKDDVALYIHLYEHLPDNYITKDEARDLGWDSRKGNLWDVAPGKSIGGDRFGNYEKLLPVRSGRKYFECDVDYEGGYRDEKRIIYSNDGLIYYTDDHYNSFEQLYNKEGRK